MKIAIGIVLMVPLAIVLSMRGCASIRYDQGIGGHITNAAHANTVDLARQQMEDIVTEMEVNGMTAGYTSVVYRTPDEDVGYWYANMKAARDDLRKLNPATLTPLEQSNTLLKLHETLNHQPDGITAFPHNTAYAVWTFVSLGLALVGGVMVGVSAEDLL